MENWANPEEWNKSLSDLAVLAKIPLAATNDNQPSVTVHWRVPRSSRVLAEISPSFGLEYCHHVNSVNGLLIFRVLPRYNPFIPTRILSSVIP